MPCTSNEQCIPREDRLVVPIFEEVTDAILGVTWSMKCSNFDIRTNRKRGPVFRRIGNGCTILSPYYWYRVLFELTGS
jgi:hypothetical protein